MNRKLRATSLVEVLVVMVVLLIGIFAVVRLFPVGFGYLSSAGARTTSARLATNFMESTRGDAINLPEGVTTSWFDPATGEKVTVAGLDPDELDALANNPYYSDINRTRYIENEPVKIPLATQATFGATNITGGIYTLKYGPVLMHPTVGDPSYTPGTSHSAHDLHDSYLKVTSAPLIGIPGESNNGNANTAGFYGGRLRTPQNYVIDYGDDRGDTGGFILFQPSPHEREFVISYQVDHNDDDNTDPSITTEEEVMTVPANFAGWMVIPGAGGAGGILPGSERVVREFERLPIGTAWDTNDPYQYQLLSGNITPSATGTSQANLGVLAFNPAGANFSEATPTGQRPFLAYVSYAVLDWHIIRDDREVPSVFTGAAGDAPLRLTLNNIKRNGQTERDGTPYEGIFPPEDTGANADIQVFRLQPDAGVPGQPLTSAAYNGGNPFNVNVDYWVENRGRENSYKTGTIYINTNRVPAGTQLRILYKANNDWGVALHKAMASYRPTIVGGVTQTRPLISAGSTVAIGTTTRPLPIGNPGFYGIDGTRLYFTRSELNKSVSVTVETVDPMTNDVTRLAPRQVTIDRAGAGVDRDYAYVDLGSEGENIVASGQAWRVAGHISGVSVKARVVWKDSNVGSGGRPSKWQVQDLDTYLTREAGR